MFLSDVLLQVGVLGEPQAAPATDVGLHALVEQLVAGQVVLVFELLMTDLSYRADQYEYRGFGLQIKIIWTCCPASNFPKILVLFLSIHLPAQLVKISGSIT